MRGLVLLCCLLSSFAANASVNSIPSTQADSACPLPPEYVMMSCLEGAETIEQGYLMGDDGVTKIGVLRLTDAPMECRTNMLSHPFVIELMRMGKMKESIWFNSHSVDAVLKGDSWKRREHVLHVAKGDIFLHRTEGEVDSVGLVKDVVDSGNPNSVWMTFEFKTDGAKEKTGSILVERENHDNIEIWSPKTQDKSK